MIGQQQPIQQQLTEQQQREAEAHARAEARKAHVRARKQYNLLVNHTDYGQVYEDDTYEYRNVTLPKVMLRLLPRNMMVYPDNQNSFVLRLLKGNRVSDILHKKKR